MNTKVIIIALMSFLLGATINIAHIFPFPWGIPFFADWDHLVTFGLVIGIFLLYNKINEVEKRMSLLERRRD